MKFFLPLVLISVVLNAAPIYLKCEIVDKTPSTNETPKNISLEVKLNEETNEVTVSELNFGDSYNMKGFFDSNTIKAQRISNGSYSVKTVYEIDRKTLGINRTSTIQSSYKRFEGTCNVIEVSKNKI
jgi:hypothetical protein